MGMVYHYSNLSSVLMITPVFAHNERQRNFSFHQHREVSSLK